MIVEDSPLDRDAIKFILRGMGYQNVAEAGDGQSAIEFLTDPVRNTPPVEFIISDLKMMKMSGMEFLKEVRANDSLRHLPFILVTTEDAMNEVLNAIVAGVSDYIVKPVTEAILKKKMLAAYLKMSNIVGAGQP